VHTGRAVITGDAELRRRHPASTSRRCGQPSPSPPPAPSVPSSRRHWGRRPRRWPSGSRTWPRGAGHFADRLANRQSMKIPSEDPDYGDLGQAFPARTSRGREPILQPPKPEIPPSPADPPARHRP
jgi:hypothetical protein